MSRIILFTKAPRLGYGKSRMKDMLDDEARLALSRKLIENSLTTIKKSGNDYVIYYRGEKEDLDFTRGRKEAQAGEDLGRSMYKAFDQELGDISRALLIGSDVMISPQTINQAFEELKTSDVVIAPANDGGYGLIGMKEPHDLFSGIRYSRPDVYKKTLDKIREQNLTCKVLDETRDLDDKEDLVKEELGEKELSYENKDGLFTFTGKRLGLITCKDTDKVKDLYLAYKKQGTKVLFKEEGTFLPQAHIIVKEG